jgi:dienelactone hydrolase
MYSTPRKVNFSLEKKDSYSLLTFKSPMPSGNNVVDEAKALFFQPKTIDYNKALIFVHGTGQKNFEHLKYYPKFFSNNGYATLMPVLPYHFDRTPPGKKSGTAFIKGTDVELANRFDQAVTDILTCIDFLENKGFTEINIMGFSFGGMISTIAMAIDKRIKKGIFVVTGGNYEYITWKSVATKILRISYEENKECNPQECALKHQIFDTAAKNFRSLNDLKDMPVCFTYDPSIFAHLIPPRKTIFFKAAFDPFIPSASSDDLWRRLGMPKRYVLPSGHLSAHLIFKKFIAKKSLEFLNQ